MSRPWPTLCEGGRSLVPAGTATGDYFGPAEGDARSPSLSVRLVRLPYTYRSYTCEGITLTFSRQCPMARDALPPSGSRGTVGYLLRPSYCGEPTRFPRGRPTTASRARGAHAFSRGEGLLETTSGPPCGMLRIPKPARVRRDPFRLVRLPYIYRSYTCDGITLT